MFFRRGTLTAIAGFAAVAALTAACSPLPPAQDDATRFPDAARESADVVALFRAADAIEFEQREGAARAALLGRFPPGSDSSALVASLTGTGHGRCRPTVLGNGRRGNHCLVR